MRSPGVTAIANTRQPVETEGDVYSLAACNDIGCTRLVEMMDEFGLDDLNELGGHVIDRSREAMLRLIAELPHGTWIRGRGWDQNDWPDKRFPTATQLDTVAPKHPVWYYNLKADPNVEIRDKTEVTAMRVREVADENERARQLVARAHSRLHSYFIRLDYDVEYSTTVRP